MTALVMSETQSKQLKISGWFSEYGNRLLRYVRSKIKDIDEAEDITQEVWYQLSRQDEIETIEQIGSWLFTVANNRVINFYKKKKSIPFSQFEADIAGTQSDEAYDEDEIFFNRWSEENLPSDIVERKEFWEILQKLLLQLPPEQREVFIKNELNDVSFREMAEKTGISINTLLARKRYAVIRLKKEFEKLFNL
jgi:RNA polymerase sigma factor (sigma-70 family)